MVVRRYTVQKGDTLWGIAESHLGGGREWPRIWHYNSRPDIAKQTGHRLKDPDLLMPGQLLLLPDLHARMPSPPRRKPSVSPLNGVCAAPPALLPSGDKPWMSLVRERKVVDRRASDDGVRERTPSSAPPMAIQYDLEEFKPPPIVHPNALISIRMSGELVLALRETNPSLTLNNREQLELKVTNEANQAFGSLVNEAALDLDLKSAKLTYSTQLVSRSTTPNAPTTAVGFEISSHNPIPTLRFELRYKLLDGTVGRFRFLAGDVVITIDVTPHAGASRRVPQSEPASEVERIWKTEPSPWRETVRVAAKVVLVTAVIIVVGLLIWYFLSVASLAAFVEWLMGLGGAAAAAAAVFVREKLRQRTSVPRAPLAAAIQHRAHVTVRG